MKKIIILLLVFVLCGCSVSSNQQQENTDVSNTPVVDEVEKTSITLSFVGDITLGNFKGMSYSRSFDKLYKDMDGDKTYFMKKVKSVFEQDDLTIGNLEGPLTTATKSADKRYIFKGKPEYAEILTEGDFEIVSLANNHSADYFEKGRTETKDVLDSYGIDHFGYENVLIKEVKGKKIGFIGYSFASNESYPKSVKEDVTNAIADLKDKTDIIVVYYHWGIMYDTSPEKSHVKLAHYTIDQGADLVLGAHPHIIQGMETYKGKNIVYSLGNFCYGGNLNPKDTDSMIFQQTFNFEDDELVSSSHNVIAAAMSSHENKKRNNFQPTVLEGEEKERWEKKFEDLCEKVPSVE